MIRRSRIDSCGRCPCSRSAQASTLNRLSEVESAQITSSACAPISSAMRAPTRAGRSIQPAAFHEPMSPRPHSWRTTSFTRAAVVAGRAPSELPSR